MLGFRHVSSLLYETTLVRGPQITMDGPDFTALGFAADGPNWAGDSLMGRAQRGEFWAVFVFGSDL